jgi:spore maturation protein CgeB
VGYGSTSITKYRFNHVGAFKGLAVKMKALVVGPAAADFNPGYNHAIVRALNQLGYEAEICEFYVTTPPGLLNRIVVDGGLKLGYHEFYDRYVIKFNRRLLALYKKQRPDIVIVIRGSKVSASTLKAMSAIKVLWLHDLARRCDLHHDQLSAYDNIYVFESSDVEWLQRSGLLATFLPIAFDPDVYRPLDVGKDIDVFFIGAYYPDRRDLLEQLAQHFPSETLRFYGRHLRYREPSTWIRYFYYIANGKRKVFPNRSLNASQINEMYSRSKICINIHHGQSENGCNPRVFEIIGSGSYQIVDQIPFIKREFGDLLTTFRDGASLKEAIREGLDDEKIRSANIETLREIVQDKHTFSHRIKVILRDCNLTP